MSTRFRCSEPAPSTAIWRASYASWRGSVFPGPRRSLWRLAGSFDRRAAHFDAKAERYTYVARQGCRTAILPPRDLAPTRQPDRPAPGRVDFLRDVVGL